MEQSRARLLSPALAVAGLLAMVYWPTLRWLVLSWLGNPYYAHGPLVPLLALGLAWRLERAPAPECAAPRGAAGMATIAAGLGLHLLALARGLYPLSAASLPLTLAGVLLTLAGPEALRRQAFPLAFALLMIPLPWLEQATPPLAQWAAAGAAWLAQRAGVAVTLDGARLQLAGAALVVGAPCSGVHSLAALTTLGALYAYLVEGPLAARVALGLLSAPLALGANLLRVLLLIVVADRTGVAAATGLVHDLSSPLLFLGALAGLVLLGRGLRCRGLRSAIC